jgi:large conductance mechanosensitive channel
MIDLAVGLIIGAAFGKIVSSLVKDVIMPPIGLLLGGVDFSDLFINLSGQAYASLAQAQAAGAATVNIGRFINHLIDFVIVGGAMFLLVKTVNQIRLTAPIIAPGTPSAPALQSELLLAEIRDLLRDRA